MTIPSAQLGVRIRLVGGADSTAHGTGFTEYVCYDTDSTTNGVVRIAAVARREHRRPDVVRNAWLLPGSGSCAPDAYFAAADCSVGIQAEVDLGADHPFGEPGLTAEVWASVDGVGTYPLEAAFGLDVWTRYMDGNQRCPDRRRRPSLGRAALELEADHRDLEWPGLQKKKCETGTQSFGPVQRAFIAGGRSGPLRRVQVYESGWTSGSNSFEMADDAHDRCERRLTGSLKVQSLATDPVVELRVTGGSR